MNPILLISLPNLKRSAVRWTRSLQIPEPVRAALARGSMTGSSYRDGRSLNAAYPAVVALGCGPLPVQLVNSAELLHYLRGRSRNAHFCG